MKKAAKMCIAAAVACLATQAGATRAADSVTLAGVTVTAIKQSADLRTQATASTVISRYDVERGDITGARAASGLVPNLYIPDYGSRMTSTIYVRGIGARIDQPAVGLNVDNVPVLCKENYDFDLLDISRIEVMRGPQSTLYGRNTMGGVINVYTLSPMSYQGTRLMGEYSSGNSYRAGASHYALVAVGGSLFHIVGRILHKSVHRPRMRLGASRLRARETRMASQRTGDRGQLTVADHEPPRRISL